MRSEKVAGAPCTDAEAVPQMKAQSSLKMEQKSLRDLDC